MSPVPVNPNPDFVAGTAINPDAVDANFAELYKTLDPAQRGLDWTNVRTGGLADLVTSLPASPRDGQECYFLADAAKGVVWHLRYRAASASTYKWERIAGAPLTDEIVAAASRGSTVYGDLVSSVGPTVTLPLAGEYEFHIECTVTTPAVAALAFFLSLSFAGGVPSDNDAVIFQQPSAAVFVTTLSRNVPPRVVAAAATAVKHQVKTSDNANLMTAKNRVLSAMPVRVG